MRQRILDSMCDWLLLFFNKSANVTSLFLSLQASMLSQSLKLKQLLQASDSGILKHQKLTTQQSLCLLKRKQRETKRELNNKLSSSASFYQPFQPAFFETTSPSPITENRPIITLGLLLKKSNLIILLIEQWKSFNNFSLMPFGVTKFTPSAKFKILLIPWMWEVILVRLHYVRLRSFNIHAVQCFTL